ncbi:MAG: hypothetical protein IJ036_02890 [Lachnospiraceae bacterium]|nr:hypothetical protein [Lachnospiraceae bacterium]
MNKILDKLDEVYGVTKEGFFHQEPWQLLVAIMLSAQSTDKQVLPKEHWIRINFQLIYHGRAICTARKAYCEKCMLSEWCPKKIEEKKAKEKA